MKNRFPNENRKKRFAGKVGTFGRSAIRIGLNNCITIKYKLPQE